MDSPSPAPPVQQGRPIDEPPAFSPRFWAALALIGIASGIGGALLMRLLYAVQAFA